LFLVLLVHDIIEGRCGFPNELTVTRILFLQNNKDNAIYITPFRQSKG